MNLHANIIGRLRTHRGTALAVLAAVAFLQFAMASHEASHSLADSGETCHSCVQFDENNAPVEVQASAAPVFSRVADTAPPHSLFLAFSQDTANPPRAPPVS